MKRLTGKEWEQLYRAIWRKPYAHLSKEERRQLVLGCRSKVHYSSPDEAREMLRILQPRGKLQLSAYSCPLCGGIHISNRRHQAQYRKLLLSSAALIDQMGETAPQGQVVSGGGSSERQVVRPAGAGQ
jgi:hypothetical protein